MRTFDQDGNIFYPHQWHHAEFECWDYEAMFIQPVSAGERLREMREVRSSRIGTWLTSCIVVGALSALAIFAFCCTKQE